MDHNQPLLGAESVTANVYLSTACVRVTGFIPDLSPLVHASDLTRSMLNFAVSAVNSSPLEKCTPFRR